MNKKEYLVWHKRLERMGNATDVNEVDGLVTVQFFDSDKGSHHEVVALNDVKLFQYSGETDASGNELAEDAMVEIKDLKEASMGIVAKSNNDNWYVVLYELIGNQYSPENGKTLPLTSENIEKHRIRTNGHLELFAKHMRENT